MLPTRKENWCTRTNVSRVELRTRRSFKPFDGLRDTIKTKTSQSYSSKILDVLEPEGLMKSVLLESEQWVSQLDTPQSQKRLYQYKDPHPSSQTPSRGQGSLITVHLFDTIILRCHVQGLRSSCSCFSQYFQTIKTIYKMSTFLKGGFNNISYEGQNK